MMALTPGSRLGLYEIRAPLGAGGMGEVYRALDPKLQRDVAIKVLPEALASDPQALARFEREARAVAALSHPHILAIHDFGVADGTAYAVMELLEGETLREKLVAGPLPTRKAAELGAQIADGLAAAHEKGIVHRDLKPENVFVTREGRVKILDFGLARQGPTLAPGDESHSPTVSRHTDPGTVLGTVGYMSPEQVRGRSVDHRSDIFSIGSMLFEMVTGTRAFRRESSVETMNAILKEDPLDAPPVEGTVAPGLERILRHCLEKSPDERFQSARDLAFDLTSLTGGTASGRASVVASPQSARWLLAVTAALLAGFGIGYWFRSRVADEAKPPLARYLRVTEEPGLEPWPSLSPDGKTVAYAAGAPGRRAIHTRRVGGRNAVLLTRDCDRDNSAPAFSPDGERIAYRSECEGGGIFVMGATGESTKRVADFGFTPAWSPDGTSIVFATENIIEDPLDRNITSELWMVPAGGGERHRIFAGDAVQPAWSPNGQRIAFWGLRRADTGQRDLFTVKADGSDLVEITNDGAVDWAPRWAASGRELYFASDRGGTMNLWRVAVDQETGVRRGSPEPVGVPASWMCSFSPARDGRTLAFVAAELRSSAYVVDFDPVRGALTSAPRQVIARSGNMVGVDLSTDGAWLVLNDQTRSDEIILIRPDGSGFRQLVEDSLRNRHPRFSPDGDRIAFYSDRGGSYALWSIRHDGSDLQPLSPPGLGLPAGAYYPIWSPDGRRLAATDLMSSIYILDLERPLAERLIETLPVPNLTALWPIDWSPDGARLAIVGKDRAGTDASYVYALASRALTKVAACSGGGGHWLRDSRRLVVACGNRLVLVDSVTGSSRDLLSTIQNASLNAAISQDQYHIAFVERILDGDIWAMTLP